MRRAITKSLKVIVLCDFGTPRELVNSDFRVKTEYLSKKHNMDREMRGIFVCRPTS
jgi:hypothetical protein